MSQAKRMIKHSSIYAVGNISRQLVGFIMLPIYTRYLTPSDYGVIGLLIFVISLIEVVFGARMFQAVPKFYYEQKNKRDAHSVISTALVITSIASSLAMLAILTFREPIAATAFGSTEHSYLVGIFALLVLTHALENYSLGYVRIQQRPWFFIGASMTKLFMQLSLNILLVVVFELGVLGIAISNVASSVIFAAVMITYTLWHTGINFCRSLARRMVLFCWPLWLAGLAALYMGSANRYYIRVFSSLDEVGLFELATKFGSIISLLVWTPFLQYWQTERFSLYQQPNPTPIYQAVFRLVTTMLVLVALGVAIFGGPVIRLMAAPDFHIAATAIPYLVFSTVFSCLTVFTNFSFFVKEKTGLITWNTYGTAVVITALYLALIPVNGFVGAAQALMVAKGLQFLAAHWLAKKHYDMGLSLRPLAAYLSISFVTVLFAFHFQQDNLIADIVVKIAIYLAGCALVGGCLLANSNVRDYIFSVIGTRFPFKGRLSGRS